MLEKLVIKKGAFLDVTDVSEIRRSAVPPALVQSLLRPANAAILCLCTAAGFGSLSCLRCAGWPTACLALVISRSMLLCASGPGMQPIGSL